MGETSVFSRKTGQAPPSGDASPAFGGNSLLAEQVLEFHRRYGFKCALETGTRGGHTTVALAAVFPRVFTVEIDAERFAANRQRFEACPNVTALHGRSPAVLLDLIEQFDYPLFAFLDARGGERWPLRDELTILLGVPRPKLMLIHDFKVPGRDAGDDPSGGQECSPDDIGDLLPRDECRCTFTPRAAPCAAPHSASRGVCFIEHLL